jgi:hypothetical protein
VNIKVNTQCALELLASNRKKHIDEFTSQMHGWKEAMERFSKELITWKDNASEDIFSPDDEKKYRRPIEPMKPMSYVNDYDKFIELLQHHQEKLIELDEHEFEQIIKDEFNWKGHFTAMSNTYSIRE